MGLTKTLTVTNRLGLHARPAALLIQALQPFPCHVSVECRGEAVNAKSIFGLLSLAAAHGTKLTFKAIGPESRKALEALERLFQGDFAEID